MADVNFDPLNHLLKAGSKEVIHTLCQQAFIFKDHTVLPDQIIKKTAEALTIQGTEAKQLIISLSALIKNIIFDGVTDVQGIQELFPDDFHKNLKDLLAKILAEKCISWRLQVINNHISLPKLVDFDWCVNIKTSSDSITKMAVPSCMLQVKIEEMPTDVNILPDMSSVNVELTKETLDTMLDGLGKIRDQLSSVASR